MRTAALLLAMAGAAWCAAGVLPPVDVESLNAALQDGAGGGGAERGQRASSAPQWLRMLEEWAREQARGRAAGEGTLQPFRLDLPFEKNGSVPLLVLPLLFAVDDAPPGFAPAAAPLLAPAAPPAPAPVPAPTEPPQMEASASSEQLVEQFRREMSHAASMAPVMLGTPPPPRAPPPPAPRAPPPPAPRAPTLPPPPPTAPPPPRPRWDRSLRVRAELRVHSADYTEPYSMWWDAASGASRVELHGGTSAALLRLQPDGRHQRVEYYVDNIGTAPVRRCGFGPTTRLPPAELGPPALPDPTEFEFAGYSSEPEGNAEVWRRLKVGGPGEGGAARGEVLTFRHELVVLRGPELAARPLRYSVWVDSSYLGPRCDGYEHRFLEARLQPVEPSALQLDARACDARELLEPDTEPAHAARLQPLREFTMPMRDTRYDVLLDQFKLEFNRDYMDDKEEAVRKNLFVQASRFIASANRQGASFELGTNFLSDRLGAELDELRGVVDGPDDSERFPYPPAELQRLQEELPAAFDWRNEGGVSPVRFQGSCKSCWAVAVAGAVEGALFARTRRLVPLAEQTLVDCAQPFGGNGCNGTWPSRAYDYVKARGLPPLDQYGPHKERVEACRDARATPATHISAHVNVTAGSAPALRVAIRDHAPAVVIIDAEAKSFIFYKRGILYDDRCAKKQPNLNHAVLAVGWGAEDEQEYFTVKNSWSAAWGEAGYARLHAASNACGLLSLASYPRLDRDDLGDQRAQRRSLDPAASAPDSTTY